MSILFNSLSKVFTSTSIFFEGLLKFVDGGANEFQASNPSSYKLIDKFPTLSEMPLFTISILLKLLRLIFSWSLLKVIGEGSNDITLPFSPTNCEAINENSPMFAPISTKISPLFKFFSI